MLLGLVAGILMKVRRTGNGSLVTVAGSSYAAVWIATIAGRLLFAYGANDWFAPQIADFSRSLGIDGSAAYTSAFVIMALAMGGDPCCRHRIPSRPGRPRASPGPSAGQSSGSAPTTLIFTTTLTEGRSPTWKDGPSPAGGRAVSRARV